MRRANAGFWRTSRTTRRTPRPPASEALRSQVGQRVVAVLKCRGWEPIAKAIGLQQKDKIPIIDPGNAGHCQRCATMLTQQPIEPPAKPSRLRPVDGPISKNKSVANGPGELD